MAAFNHVRDINDAALKPRLLHVLLKEHLPSETRPLQDPGNLTFVVSTLKTHNLLSEQIPHGSDHKLASNWSSAVDAWVDRIVSLARCNLSDKCWAGVCLLGVTCIECKSERLLASISDWCNVFLSHIQSSGVSRFVRIASCAAVSDLLTRLGGFSSVKKDGISHAGKLVQPILKILNEDATEDLLEVAAHLLFSILTNFPLSVQRHYDNAEAAIVSRIISGNCSVDLLKKLSCCLALLPKARVEEKSWSMMMQKILLALSTLLDSAFEGFEEDSRRGEAVALMVPPGKDPPPPLGGLVIGAEVLGIGERPQQSVISAILSLLQCCCPMLTNSYPVQVVVPVRPLLATVGRVLMVNGSLPEALQEFTTAMQQESVCLYLPVLHKNVLDILAALNNGLRSQILPHGADIIWILVKYFQKCRLPELRTKAYTITRSLLISMGAGMALYIAQDLIDNAVIDLKATDLGGKEEPSVELSVEPSSRHQKKKRKHGYASQSRVEQHASNTKKQEGPQGSILRKIAATETLESLLIVGGALKSDGWRSGVDHLLMDVAMNACHGGWMDGGKPFLSRDSGAGLEDFQLVALHALLASLLSPASVRPPYLAQGLELFNRGKQNSGTKVAKFCAQSLLALEVLIHPRALPLLEAHSSTVNGFGRMDVGSSKYKSLAGGTVHGVYPDVYDIQDYANMEDGFGDEFPAAKLKEPTIEGISLDLSVDLVQGEPKVISDSFGKATAKDSDEPSEPISICDKTEGTKDSVMLDKPAFADPVERSPFRMPLGAQTRPENDVSASVNAESISEMHVPSKSTASAAGDGSALAPMTDDRSLKRRIEEDDESSSSFPDIVDADPDTDSDLESDS